MKKRVLFGWIFLAIGITPVLTFLSFSRPEYIVWFSNHTFIVLGLALLLKSPFWAFAQLLLGAIPELTWSLDFLWRMFTGEHIWGFTSYMFKNGAFDWLHLYSLQHLLFVPAALYAMYLLGGPVKKAYLGSLGQGAAMWGVSMALPFDLNINCVNYQCMFDLPFYQITWPFLIFIHIFLVYGLVLNFYKKKKKK